MLTSEDGRRNSEKRDGDYEATKPAKNKINKRDKKKEGAVIHGKFFYQSSKGSNLADVYCCYMIAKSCELAKLNLGIDQIKK